MVEHSVSGLVHPVLALGLSPLLFGVINRVKAAFAGRRGAPVLQPYYDLHRLLRKGVVYSQTATWLLPAGPVVGVAAMLAATLLVPFAGLVPGLSFSGDLLVVVALCGVMRFFTVLAALDTGSAFEGMGASREVTFAALAEPPLLLGLLFLAVKTRGTSLHHAYGGLTFESWLAAGPGLMLVAVAFFVLFLAENARIPVDDPNTHLELTMIHEVMVLDHSGVDFGLVQYGAALKMWVLGALLVGLLLPWTGSIRTQLFADLAAMLLLAVATGIVESVMARVRLVRVPQLLVGALVLTSLALVLAVR